MRSRIFTPWILAYLTLAISSSIHVSVAQEKVTSALIKPDTAETLSPSQDTLRYQFSSMRVSDERQKKSGNLAMLFSAILPGSGQIYAHRYYTIPLIWGFGYYFFQKYQSANNTYHKFQNLYAKSLTDSTTQNDPFLQGSYHGSRESWHNFRDEMGVYLVLTYFLNIIDAFVGATLYNFDVSDDLGGNAKIRFQIPFR
jgi:hypothetical protein